MFGERRAHIDGSRGQAVDRGVDGKYPSMWEVVFVANGARDESDGGEQRKKSTAGSVPSRALAEK